MQSPNSNHEFSLSVVANISFYIGATVQYDPQKERSKSSIQIFARFSAGNCDKIDECESIAHIAPFSRPNDGDEFCMGQGIGAGDPVVSLLEAGWVRRVQSHKVPCSRITSSSLNQHYLFNTST